MALFFQVPFQPVLPATRVSGWIAQQFATKRRQRMKQVELMH